MPRERYQDAEFAIEGQEPRPWPTIILPEERREQLTRKLEEYKTRMQEGDAKFQHPDFQLMLGSDAASKAAILERLLKDGQVNTRELATELKHKLGDIYNPTYLIVPILVIKDYCETGGAHTGGGTGLPVVEKRVRQRARKHRV